MWAPNLSNFGNKPHTYVINFFGQVNVKMYSMPTKAIGSSVDEHSLSTETLN